MLTQLRQLGCRIARMGGAIFVVGVMVACQGNSVGCEDVLGCVVIRANEPVQIGALLTLSGVGAELGEESHVGIAFALSERDYKLLGHTVSLIEEDAGCTAVTGQTAVTNILANTQLLGIIGANCTTTTEGALPAISQAGLVLISPSNTAPKLTADNIGQGFYRTAPNLLWQGAFTANYVYTELGHRTAVTIRDNTPYATTLEQTFSDTFQEQGGTVLYRGHLSPAQSDITDLLTTILANPPDVIYLALFDPEASYLINHFAEAASLKNVTLIASDSLFASTFAQASGAAAQGLYIVAPTATSPSYRGFLDRWFLQNGAFPSGLYHAHAYDATNLLLNAIAEVAEVTQNDTLLIGRQDLRDALNHTQNLEGLTGPLTCNPQGDCGNPLAFGVYQLTEAETTGLQWPPALIWQPVGEP